MLCSCQCCTTVCRRVCLSASVGRSMDVRRPYMCPFRPQRGPCVHGATHLPYDKEDECSAQHQGEHVAEGRKGERHGCASQPDDEMGWAGEREVPPPALCLSFGFCPLSLLRWAEVIVCFPLRRELSLCRPGRQSTGLVTINMKRHSFPSCAVFVSSCVCHSRATTFWLWFRKHLNVCSQPELSVVGLMLLFSVSDRQNVCLLLLLLHVVSL